MNCIDNTIVRAIKSDDNLGDIRAMLLLYRTHSLDDLSNATLMNRVDNKFIIAMAQLPTLLERIRCHYSVLEINEQQLFRYQNVYYDTPEYQYYHMHHNGKLNRFKVRYRHYVDTQTQFLEVKFKNNKKRTTKYRCPVAEEPDSVIADCERFLLDKGIKSPGSLKAALQGSYNRIALANEDAAERLTIDVGLHFSNPVDGLKTVLNNTAVVELKQRFVNRKSPLLKLMQKWRVMPKPFSKYCLGMCLSSQGPIKTNRFKKTLRQIDYAKPNDGCIFL